MFKLKDYFKLSINGGVLISNVYKPYINYDWSTTTTSGLRYLKDVGSTPTYDASMYFGRGAYFNGVDQKVDYGTLPTSSPEVSMTITGKSIVCNHKYNFWIKPDGFAYYLADGVTLVFENITYNIANTYTFNITPTLIEVFENGVKILTRIPKSILSGGDKTIGVRKTSFYASVIKDVYMFNRVLSQSEITQSYEQPEAFYAMAQADSTCVLNMPMCETDGYVRNMKSYSEGTNLYTSGFSVATSPTITDITNGFNIVKISAESVTWFAVTNVAPTTDAIVKISFNFNLSSGSVYPIINGYYTSTGQKALSSSYQIKEGYNELVIQAWASTRLAYLMINGISETFTWNITNIIVKTLTGIYPITNYTSSVRDNAKNLRYGLQTCKFVRDGLGVIQSASDYLECDGVGYVGTGWIPSTNTDWTIEAILPKAKVNIYEGIGIENGVDSMWIRRDSASATARYGNGLVVTLSNDNNKAYMYVCCVLNNSINTVSCFSNSVYSGASQDNSVAIVSNFTLGKINKRTDKNMNNPLRLFKVHNKALTQEEITKNYNDYVSKGLLA